MQHSYSYQSALATSERIGWKLEDLIGGDKKLDFTNGNARSRDLTKDCYWVISGVSDAKKMCRTKRLF